MLGKLFKKGAGGPEASAAAKLPKPKDIPQPLGQTLVLQRKLDPDWVWQLKCVVKPLSQAPKRWEFRIYDDVKAREQGVAVKDFTSLDQHTKLILFYGWLDEKSKEMELLAGGETQKAS